jgi:hypothetical protein
MAKLHNAGLDLHLLLDDRDCQMLVASPQPTVGGADGRAGGWDIRTRFVQVDGFRFDPLDHLA